MKDGVQGILDLAVARRSVGRWLEATVAETGLGASQADAPRLLAAFSSAARHLGKAKVAPTEEERAQLRGQGIDWSLDPWCTDELGRAALLGEVFRRLSPPEAASLLLECYARADNRERQAVLRVLPVLPDAGRFVALAIDACRSSVQTIFEAIACENPFPAREVPDLGFNQMVLKAMFTGVALARIVGLERRRGPELARMADDYAAERRAAGRSVPADIHLAGGTA